eukprot:scaffold323_cov232-Pinguiococcus_pyrenoidosus.AAC.18
MRSSPYSARSSPGRLAAAAHGARPGPCKEADQRNPRGRRHCPSVRRRRPPSQTGSRWCLRPGRRSDPNGAIGAAERQQETRAAPSRCAAGQHTSARRGRRRPLPGRGVTRCGSQTP